MSHDSFDWIKLILDNWKVILAVLLFFGAGSGLGYGSHPYINEAEVSAKTEIKPCICGVSEHLKEAH